MEWFERLSGKEKAIGIGLVLGLVALVYAVRKGGTSATATPTGPYVLSDVPQGTIPVVGSGGVYPTPVPGPSTPGTPVPTPTPTPTPGPGGGNIHPPNPIPYPGPPVIVTTPDPVVTHPPVYVGRWNAGTVSPNPNPPAPNVAGAMAYLQSLTQINGPMANPPNANVPASYQQVIPGSPDVGTYTPAPIGPPVLDTPVAAQPVVTSEDLMGVSQGGTRYDNVLI